MEPEAEAMKLMLAIIGLVLVLVAFPAFVGFVAIGIGVYGWLTREPAPPRKRRRNVIVL